MNTYVHVRGSGPYEVIESNAPAPEGWRRMTIDEYNMLAAEWSSIFEQTQLEQAPVRELSKLMIRRRLRALGKEALFDATLDAVPNARVDWDDAQVIRTDDPLFTTHAAAFKAALNLTDEQFNELIA